MPTDALIVTGFVLLLYALAVVNLGTLLKDRREEHEAVYGLPSCDCAPLAQPSDPRWMHRESCPVRRGEWW